MQVKGVISPIVQGVRTGIKTVSQSSSHYGEVAERAARMQNINPPCKNVAVLKGYIIGAFNPIIEKMNGLSDSFSIVTKTLKHVSKTVNKTVGKTLEENPDASKFNAKMTGIKESMPVIKDALKEVGGVNDVKAATAAGGKVKGAIEAGKAAVRVTSSTGLAVVGTFVPVPGATVAGWLAGEKLTNACLGKPFTKQAKNVIENLSK